MCILKVNLSEEILINVYYFYMLRLKPSARMLPQCPQTSRAVFVTWNHCRIAQKKGGGGMMQTTDRDYVRVARAGSLCFFFDAFSVFLSLSFSSFGRNNASQMGTAFLGWDFCHTADSPVKGRSQLPFKQLGTEASLSLVLGIILLLWNTNPPGALELVWFSGELGLLSWN